MIRRLFVLLLVSWTVLGSSAEAFKKRTPEPSPEVTLDPPDESTCVSLPEVLAGKEVLISNLYDDGVLMSRNRGHLMIGNGEDVVVFRHIQDDETSQRWKLEPVGGYYKILNHWDNRALTTAHNSADPEYQGDGEPLILYDYYGDPTQHWCLQGCFPDPEHSQAQDREGECPGVVIRNAYDGRVLSTQLAGEDPRKPVALNPASDDLTRTWRLWWWDPKPIWFVPTKVELYTDAACTQGKWELKDGRYDLYLLEMSGFGNDTARAVRVPPHWRVTLYENDALMGASKTVEAVDNPRTCIPLEDFEGTSSVLVEQGFANEHVFAEGTCTANAARLGWNCAGTGPFAEHGKPWCTQIDEPSDPDTWDDNYLCSRNDEGVRWSYAGPIANMKCTQIDELAEPADHAWGDNWLCVPSGSRLDFTWSTAGPIEGKSCIQWKEPADPHTWDDNFLCWEE